eukprot:CAMPEP_0172319704 /NCGR_PEP_ID=MMETSP1058-20130122/38456_1 /TAXON_ID=83371 /ORGANISM="Detonula confervacea, Strain CCMP 353" /LENGTH=348 /DNA_ID=CAMNT_0013034815 /DNA_START=91 /DNA_END=1137 /DNA_ORIENTATION=-
MASEGSREIEAAKQRLGAAKTQAASAAKMMEHAKAMSEAAEKEVKAAEECLKGAEKRWEVIEVDSDDDESQGMKSRKKRRKVSLSPDGISNGDVRAHADSATVHQIGGAVGQTGGTVVGVAAAGAVKGPSIRTVSIPIKFSDGDHWGHTVLGVNGTYRRTEEMNDGVAMYRKQGLWNGEEVDFVMYRETNRWCIGVSGCTTLFVNTSIVITELPPRVRWVRIDKMKLKPTPEVRNAQIPSCMKVAKILVEGCGIAEVNGTYVKYNHPNDGVSTFYKMGEWEGKPVKFLLFRGQNVYGSKSWAIRPEGGQTLYTAHCSAEAQVPPTHGWVARGKGVSPAPKFNCSYIEE